MFNLWPNSLAGNSRLRESRGLIQTHIRKRLRSIAVVLRLVRTFDLHPEIIGLALRQPGKFHPDLLKVQARHLLVEVLGQAGDATL